MRGDVSSDVWRSEQGIEVRASRAPERQHGLQRGRCSRGVLFLKKASWVLFLYLDLLGPLL